MNLTNRKPVERIDMGGKGNPIIVDLYEDSKTVKDTSYIMRGYRTLEALHKGPEIIAGSGIRVYSAKLPQFRRVQKGVAINSAFIEPSPKEKGEYWLVVDERLSDYERLAVISHEIAHLAGGHHKDEKSTQKLAIQTLTNLVGYYDKLSAPNVSESLERDKNINFKVNEKGEGELKQALQYLINSGSFFGISQQDWYEAGLRPLPKRRGLDSILGALLLLGILFLGYSINMTGFSILSQTNDYKTLSITGILLILTCVLIWGYKLLRRQKVVK